MLDYQPTSVYNTRALASTSLAVLSATGTIWYTHTRPVGTARDLLAKAENTRTPDGSFVFVGAGHAQRIANSD